MRRLLNLNWVAAVLFPLTVILMEAFWLYPWLVWVGQQSAFTWQHPLLSLTSLILLMSTSFFATRFLLKQKWSLRWIQLSIVSWGLVAIFMVLRVEYSAGFELLDGRWFVHTGRIFLNSFSHLHPMVVALAVTVYLWWRGISLGRSPLHVDDIYRSFLVGLTALVMLIIVWEAGLGDGSLQGLTSTVGFHIVGFFFFSLMALALSHLQTIQQKILEKEEIAQILDRRWLYIMLGVVGGIVIVGIGTASIFSSEFVALLKHLWGLTYDLLVQALYYVTLPVLYVMAGLFYVAQLVINLLRGGQPPQPLQISGPTEIEDLPEKVIPYALPEYALIAIKLGVFAVVAGVVIFLLIRAIRRYQSFRVQAEIEETNESLWSWEGFKTDLRLFFSMIWKRLEDKRKQLLPSSPVPSWYAEGDVQGILSIREIYRRLLWEASCSGIARQHHETPYEYASRLGHTVPDGSEQMGELTNLYIDVRYGDIVAEDNQVSYANNLWKVLQKLLRRPGRNQQVE
ncbi:DUF4129 domain-containing protein [Chloroflexota bacterium]